MKHILPKLNYAYDDLEPHIDARTMETHYTKHHQAYVDKLNAALVGHDDLMSLSAEDLLKSLESVPEEIRTAVKNNAGGHYNHSLFWNWLGSPLYIAPEPKGNLKMALDLSFGDFQKFKEEFAKIAMGRFGSGWAWLILKDGKISFVSTANQDSPVSDGGAPVLGLDVWEHAYYLKYQNRRQEYIDAWWNVLDWGKISENYDIIISK